MTTPPPARPNGARATTAPEAPAARKESGAAATIGLRTAIATIIVFSMLATAGWTAAMLFGGRASAAELGEFREKVGEERKTITSELGAIRTDVAVIRTLLEAAHPELAKRGGGE